MTRALGTRLLLAAAVMVVLAPGAGHASDPTDGSTQVSHTSERGLGGASASAAADTAGRTLEVETSASEALPFATSQTGFARGWGLARFTRLWAPGTFPSDKATVTLSIDADSLPQAAASDIAYPECNGIASPPLNAGEGTRCSYARVSVRVSMWAAECLPDPDGYFECGSSGDDTTVALAGAGAWPAPSVGAGDVTVNLSGGPYWPEDGTWVQIAVQLVGIASVAGGGTPFDPATASSSATVTVKDISVG